MDVIVVNKFNYRKWLSLAVIIVFLALLYFKTSTEYIPEDKVVKPRIKTVHPSFEISAEVIPESFILVSSDYNSRLEKKLVENGQSVSKDQILLVFGSRELEERFIEKESNLLLEKAKFAIEKQKSKQDILDLKVEVRLSKLELEEAKFRFEAFSKLVKEGSFSALDYRSAELKVTRAEMQLSNIKERLKLKEQTVKSIEQNKLKEFSIINERVSLLKDKLEKMTIRAPFDGIVTDLDINIGDVAQAGKNLFKLNSSSYSFKASVPEHRYQEVKIGDNIEFVARNDSYNAKITRISKQVLNGYFEINAKLNFASKKDITLGHTVRGTINTSSELYAYEIPKPETYADTPNIDLYVSHQPINDKENQSSLRNFEVVLANEEYIYVENKFEVNSILLVNPEDYNMSQTIKWRSTK